MTDNVLTAYVDEYVSESDEEEKGVECNHAGITNIDGSTFCTECGSKIEEVLLDNETRYYGAADTRYAKNPCRHNSLKDEERSLHTDLEPLGFPGEIIERANAYYKDIVKDKIYRAGNRTAIVYACVYHTYLDMGEPCIPNDLAARFKLNKKGVSNGLKFFSKIYKKRPDKKYISAIDLMPKLLNDLKMNYEQQNACMVDLRKIYDYIQGKSKLFTSANPQAVAAGLVYYYLKLNGMELDKSDFATIAMLTDVTFTKIANDTQKIMAGPIPPTLGAERT